MSQISGPPQNNLCPQPLPACSLGLWRVLLLMLRELGIDLTEQTSAMNWMFLLPQNLCIVSRFNLQCDSTPRLSFWDTMILGVKFSWQNWQSYKRWRDYSSLFLPFFLPWEETRKRTLTRIQCCWHPHLRLHSFQTVGNKCLLFKLLWTKIGVFFLFVCLFK